MALIALCDCDNFFVSCERIRRPELERRPAVVLSSNDGCVIARSAEVKSMGVQMGAPYFMVRGFLASRGVAVLSGDLPYYRSVSSRVMAVLERWSDAVERYSIDEAFLNFKIMCIDDHEAYARMVRDDVRRLVGVPISIGVAPTKTLAKLASKEAKRGDGVCVMTDAIRGELLARTEIADVWGIGHSSSAFLTRWGVRSAADLAAADPLWVREKLKTHGAITQAELQGTSCIPIDTTVRPPKSVQSTHAFRSPLRERDDIAAEMIRHAAKAGAIARGHRLTAGAMSAFLLEGFISREHRFVQAELCFDHPTDDDPTLIAAALRLLDALHRDGKFYTRAGLTLAPLTDATSRQAELFDDAPSPKRARLARTVDRINLSLGYRALRPAAAL